MSAGAHKQRGKNLGVVFSKGRLRLFAETKKVAALHATPAAMTAETKDLINCREAPLLDGICVAPPLADLRLEFDVFGAYGHEMAFGFIFLYFNLFLLFGLSFS